MNHIMFNTHSHRYIYIYIPRLEYIRSRKYIGNDSENVYLIICYRNKFICNNSK